MIRSVFACVALVVLAFNTEQLSAAPMFVNGGFETGDFTGWTVSGTAPRGVSTAGTPIAGTLIPDNVVGVRTGNFAAFATLQGGATPDTLILEQTVDVDPGVPYSVSVRRGVFGSGTTYRWTNSLKVSVDSNPAGSTSGGFQVGPSWNTITFGGYTFPAGDTSATFRFEIGGWETNSLGLAGFSIDDISIQQVPEPASVTGLCFVALVAIGRRARGRVS